MPRPVFYGRMEAFNLEDPDWHLLDILRGITCWSEWGTEVPANFHIFKEIVCKQKTIREEVTKEVREESGELRSKGEDLNSVFIQRSRERLLEWLASKEF